MHGGGWYARTTDAKEVPRNQCRTGQRRTWSVPSGLPRLLRPLADPVWLALLWGGAGPPRRSADQLFAVVLSWVAVGLFGHRGPAIFPPCQAGVLMAGHACWREAGARPARPDERHDRRPTSARAAVLPGDGGGVAGGGPAGGLRPGGLRAGAWPVGMALFRPALQSSLAHLARDPALLPAANALLGHHRAHCPPARAGAGGADGGAVSAGSLRHAGMPSRSFSRRRPSASIARLRPAAPVLPRHESALTAVRRGFAAVRGHPLLSFVLCITGVINGAWSAAYFLGLPLMMPRRRHHRTAAGTGLAPRAGVSA